MAGINRTQEKGRRWICSNYNLKPGDLEFTGDAPTFITKDGRGFHVKYATYGNSVMMYPHEMSKIMDDTEANNVVFVPREGEIKMVPARSLIETPSEWGGFKLNYMESHPNGRPGEITLPLTQRSPESRYRRINHVPMDSVLVWPIGEYEIKKSMEGGHLGIFLVLRPAVTG